MSPIFLKRDKDMKFDFNSIKTILVVLDLLYRLSLIVRLFPNSKILWVDTIIRAELAVAKHNTVYDLIILDRLLNVKNHGIIKVIQEGDLKLLKDILKDIEKKVKELFDNKYLLSDLFVDFLLKHKHLISKYIIVYSMHSGAEALSKKFNNSVYIPFPYFYQDVLVTRQKIIELFEKL